MVLKLLYSLAHLLLMEVIYALGMECSTLTDLASVLGGGTTGRQAR